MPFKFVKTELPEVILVIPKVFEDHRGFFMESYKKTDFNKNGINIDFVQDNLSKSSKGVFRGLHYQLPPFPQGKLVRCSKGEILDIAVDIRKKSLTFKKWVCVSLSETNKNMLYIPPGFAHGFYTVSDTAEVAYKTTAEYSMKDDRGILWNDPEIGIKIDYDNIVLSDKDRILPRLVDADIFY